MGNWARSLICHVLVSLNGILSLGLYAHAATKDTNKDMNLALEGRTSVSSERSFSVSSSALSTISKGYFAVVNARMARTPITDPKLKEHTFTGFGSGGYNQGTWGLDALGAYSWGNSSKLISLSYGAGITYAYIPGAFETGYSHLDLFKATNRQLYQTELKHNREPAFWGRFGLTVTNLNSKYFSSARALSLSPSLRQTALSIDAYYPFLNQFILGSGFTSFSYSEEPGVVSQKLFNSFSPETVFLGGIIYGLPAFYYWAELTWQVTPWDGFIPRLQTTKTDASSDWDFSAMLTWRRRLNNNVYISPNYSFYIQGSFVSTGLGVSILWGI